ncbi:hypothetical protein KZ829_08565 [Actinoplanes hulinensis]|uniref:Uncharacterized protein n=1 Tax=Actinoplanes hulinensis TaxID=1144547 RepID=A0ABS7AYF4_9ACTN|nr:hypothetical protein [Actinoplanes hulinensis]MBW6433787.1 hypothetical protein [Actinoplanes hulinensis]
MERIVRPPSAFRRPCTATLMAYLRIGDVDLYSEVAGAEIPKVLVPEPDGLDVRQVCHDHIGSGHQYGAEVANMIRGRSCHS